MARLLGLDLGSYSVKGVVLETTLRSAAVKAYGEARCEGEGDRLTRIKGALTELLSKGSFVADQVVVAVPGLSIATHPIALPFSDPRKIELALGGEVEAELPFDLTEAAYDYQIASSDGTGSQLLVGVVKKDELAAMLAMLKELKIEPRIVTHPALAFQNLGPVMAATLAPDSSLSALGLIDIGHERTSVAIGRVGQGVELARLFAGGGQNLTRALATEFKISQAEAQAWKEEHGALGEAAIGDDGERAAGAFLRGLQPLLRDLRSTFKSYHARTRRNIEHVVLCGGTGKLPGLAAQLERDLGLPVRVLSLPADTREAIAPEQSCSAAQAYSLALRGNATGARAPRFNLRRGEFAFKSDLDFVGDKIGQLVTFAAVLLVLLIASGIVRNTVLERREKEVNAMLCDITQRVLGTCEKDVNRALNLLKGKESPASVIPKRTAVSLLSELLAHIPSEYPVTVDQIIIDLDRVSARFETDSSKHVEDVVAALKTYKCFKEVKEGKLEKNKDGSKVQFRLDIQVECPEPAAQGEG